jgi:hypothetical protein
VLLDVLIALLIVAVIGVGLATVSRRRRAALELWKVDIRTLTSGTVVEVVREGDRPQRIALLDPADDDFSMKLEDARAAALERAVALNSAREGLGS